MFKCSRITITRSWLLLAAAIGFALLWAFVTVGLISAFSCRAGLSLACEIIPIRGHWTGDFAVFWSAGRLAVEGHPGAAYYPNALNAVYKLLAHGASATGMAIWAYPPPFFAVVTGLALLPLWLGAIFFHVTSATLMAFTARWAAGMTWRRVALAFASPAAMVCIFCGQNGMLTGAIMVAGLSLAERNPALSGALLGLMVLKPQLALLVPVCLVASRNRMAFLTAGFVAVLASFLSGVAMGFGTWSLFLTQGLPEMAAFVARMSVEKASLIAVSPFAALAWLELPTRTAYALQAAVSLGCVGAIWIVWRREDTDIPARTAFTICLSLLMTNYAFVYDMVGLTVATVLFLTSSRMESLNLIERGGIAVLWLWPALCPYVGFPPASPIVLAASALIFARHIGGTSSHSDQVPRD